MAYEAGINLDLCRALVVFLVRFRSHHGQALELLASLGQISAPKSSRSSISNPHSMPSSQTNTSLQGFSGTEASVKYMQELAVNIHQPCYPYPGINVSGSNATPVSEYSPTGSLEPNPDLIIALILHFSKWVLAADVDDGLRIFTFCHTMNLRPVEAKRKDPMTVALMSGSPHHSSTSIIHSYAHHQSHCIPSHIVLEHLKSVADREVCIAFLESLISNLGEQSELFHNELVFLYLESIQKLMKAKDQREASLRAQAANGGPLESPEPLDSLAEIPVRSRQPSTIRTRGAASMDIGSTSMSTNAGSGISTRDGSRLSILRRKLLDFLRSSTSYAAEKMLSKFPRNALLEERAILLSRINQHTQALAIYAHALHDPLQAEAYAEEYYLIAKSAQQAAKAGVSTLGDSGSANVPPPVPSGVIAQGKDMYLNLLQVYLKPPSMDPSFTPSSDRTDGAPLLDDALNLLSKYHDRIDPIAALEALPPETPLQALRPYFEKLLCNNIHTLRDEKITKQLLKSEYYAVKEDHLSASRGRVVCDQNTICSKCNKKLGNSAFARYPNGQIVHYGETNIYNSIGGEEQWGAALFQFTHNLPVFLCFSLSSTELAISRPRDEFGWTQRRFVEHSSVSTIHPTEFHFIPRVWQFLIGDRCSAHANGQM